MKTLKKVLCLVLALVMVVGTMAISAAAFEDDDEITNKDAAAVLNGIKVITGYENGEFDPDGKLTRDQGATIIYKLLQATDVKLNTKFADVKGTWSENAVAYCESEGIIAGYGDGKFGPADSLTAVQFAKMILVALGYDAEVEGFVGENWDNNIIKAATAAGINVKAAAWSEPITRENAAQMAFNALTATTVKYTGGSTIEINGAKISSGAVRSNDVVAALGKSFGLVPTEGTALLTTPSLANNGTPVKNYLNTDGDVVASVAAEANKTFTVTAKTTVDHGEFVEGYVNKVLGIEANTAKLRFGEEMKVYVNGKDTSVAEVELVAGDEVELFTTTNRYITNVVVTRYELVKITDKKALTNAQVKAQADVNASKLLKAATGRVFYKSTADGATTEVLDSAFPNAADYAKGDYVLVVKSYKTEDDGSYTPVGLTASKAPATVTGKITATKGSQVLINGTYYSVSNAYETVSTAIASSNTPESTWVLDAEGKLAGYVVANVELVKDYAYIYNMSASTTGIGDGFGATSYTLYGVDPNGEKVTFTASATEAAKVDAAPDRMTNAKLVAYEIDSKGLFNVVASGAATADKYANITTAAAISKASGAQLVDTGVYANANTKFIFVEYKAGNTHKDTTVGATSVSVDSITGYAGVNVASGAKVGYIAGKNNNTASVVFVNGAKATAAGTATPYVVAFVSSTTPVVTKVNGNNLYTYDVVVDGEATTVTAVTESTIPGSVNNGDVITYTLTDGVITAGSVNSGSVTKYSGTINFVDGSQLVIGSATYDISNAKVYEVYTATNATSKTIVEGNLSAAKAANYSVTVYLKAGSTSAVTYVIIDGGTHDAY